ncbi:uncharacterized protein LOC125580881 [Brassica napus]|uniref:uncharacterized protein LOC125580881 n=1 Tax=Brassica napus TaxID=3708 RepID=UPI0020790337|nr:uncharacterized protein LOC125580881 [Brassica napus]
MSPYLFVLTMETFSRLLLSRFESGLIGYHPKTSELKLTHLMFADDVMLFFDGANNSLHGISDCLDNFGSWSGLKMNRSKTELFTSGLDEDESRAIASFGFKVGSLPIRYLGLPLMCRTNIWAIEDSTHYSWTWKQILNLRHEALNFCKAVLNSQKNLSFWYDVWTPFGQLLSFIGPSGPQSLRVPLLSTVSEACDSIGWKIASPRSQESLDLQVHLTTIALPLPSDIDDHYEWHVEGSTALVYSSALTWEALRPKAEKKQWEDSVWFKGSIPKHSFNMWVANANRLPTRVRLTSWGMNVPTACCLCALEPETRDHLLLACQYSVEVWRHSLQRLNPPAGLFSDWNELLSWIRSSAVSSPPTLQKIAVQATIFLLWKQRNNEYHNNTTIVPSVISKQIYRNVRNIIIARRKRKKFRSLLVSWIT